MSKTPLQPTDQDTIDRLRGLGSQLQDNPVWHEALDAIKADYIARWENSAVVATLERENAYNMVKAVEKLRVQLQSFAQAGKLSNDIAVKNVKGK